MANITVAEFLGLAHSEYSELSIYDYYTGESETYKVYDLLESDREDIKDAVIDSWEYDDVNILLLLSIDTTDAHEDEEDEDE